jgi:hypothetical protein
VVACDEPEPLDSEVEPEVDFVAALFFFAFFAALDFVELDLWDEPAVVVAVACCELVPVEEFADAVPAVMPTRALTPSAPAMPAPTSVARSRVTRRTARSRSCLCMRVVLLGSRSHIDQGTCELS